MRTLFCYGHLRNSLCLLIMLLCKVAAGQVFFSQNPNYVLQKREPLPILKRFIPQFPDTGIYNLHHYLPRNYLGNPGLPSPSYLLEYHTSEPGFRFFEPPYRSSRFQAENLPYFRTAGPFASLTGVAGSKEFQLFDATFTQTYRNRINVALGFRRYTSKGYYVRQQTFTNNFYFTSNYSHPKGRFGYHASYLNNSNRHNENGGIMQERLNDSTLLVDKELMGVRLRQASRDNRENQVQLSPWFRLTGPIDSANKFEALLNLKSAFKGASFEYGDRSIVVDSFYRQTFFYNDTTADSSHVRRFTNELSLLLRDRNGNAVSAGYSYETNKVWQVTDSVLSNHIVNGSVSWRTGNDSARTYLGVLGRAHYVMAGANANNYLLEASLAWNTPRQRERFALDVALEDRKPDMYYLRWRSNHFAWDNPYFRSQRTNRLRFRWKIVPGLSAGVIGEQVSDFIYFDHEALPQQLAGSLLNTRFFVEMSKVFWKHLGIGLNYDYQQTTAPSYVRLPVHHLNPRIFLQSFFFRRNLQLQLGAEAEVFDAFLPYNYMPATQAFYLQDEVQTMRYPFTTIYLNVRIRPVSVFFCLENALHGFAGPDYFLVPGYYQTDRALRFGLTWMFFD